MGTISRIDHVVLWVWDMERSPAFYQALGFEVDEGTLERHRGGRLPFVKVRARSSSAIDLRPNPSWQLMEREKGNMQHLNVAVDGVDGIQVIVAQLAEHGLKPDFGPEVQGGSWGLTSTTRTTTGSRCA